MVRDRASKERLAVQYQRAWSLYGRVGRKLSGPGGNESMAKILRAVEWQVEHFTDVPVVVVACFRGGRPPLVPLPAIGDSSYYGSIYPAVQNLLLAARAMGLGASVITLPLWSTTVVRRILGLPLSVQPCCAVPLGWPVGSLRPNHAQAGRRRRPSRPLRQPAVANGPDLSRDDRTTSVLMPAPPPLASTR